MTTTSSSWARPDLSRRQLLAGVAVAVAAVTTAGCASPMSTGGRSALSTSQADDPDVALTTETISAEEALLNFGRACRDEHPGLAPVVTAWVQRQRSHVAALRAALTDVDPEASSVSHRVPGTPQAAARVLTRLVTRAERERRAGCMSAESGQLARLLASIAASHAVSVALIRPLT